MNGRLADICCLPEVAVVSQTHPQKAALGEVAMSPSPAGTHLFWSLCFDDQLTCCGTAGVVWGRL